MRFVIQRVTEASVTINGSVRGAINKGLLVFIGIEDSDTKRIADRMIRKLLHMRIFEDKQAKVSLTDVGGELLLISQFTLFADCRKGNRPSFFGAGAPDKALKLYDYIVERCKEQGYKVEQGEFGADMKVSLLNDGPFTIILDSQDLM